MVRKILIVFGFGVILSSSILARAEGASKASSGESNTGSEPALVQTEPVYFSLEGGLYSTPQSLVLSDSQAGAVIYYTTKPGTPVSTWSIFNPASPIVINATETITAIALAPGYRLSVESAKAYHYNPAPQASAPYFSLAGGTYTTPQTLTLTSTTANASFCYTIDGKSPVDSNGMRTKDCISYSGPITVDHTELVQAVTEATGYNLSDVRNKQYSFPTSGNSMLGMLEGAISFCSKISAGSPAGYVQMDQVFTNGQNSQTLTQARNSSDYKASFSQIVAQLGGLTSSQASAQCASH